MMDRQRELSIERYLNGKMTPSEEDDFRQQLEADSKLRAMLGNDRAIRAGMLTDRNAIPTDHSRTRERMMAMAVATPTSVDLLAKSGVGKKMSGGMKAFIATMICSAVTTGALLLAPSTVDHAKLQETKSETTAPAKPAASSSMLDKKLIPRYTDSVQSITSRTDDTPVKAERSKTRQAIKLSTPEVREVNRTSKIQTADPQGYRAEQGIGSREANPKSPSSEVQPKKNAPVTITDKRLRTKVNIEIKENKP